MKKTVILEDGRECNLSLFDKFGKYYFTVEVNGVSRNVVDNYNEYPNIVDFAKFSIKYFLSFEENDRKKEKIKELNYRNFESWDGKL